MITIGPAVIVVMSISCLLFSRVEPGGSRTCAALIKIAHHPWCLRQIAVLDLSDAEAGALDQGLDRPIEMTATADPLPERRQPVLPFAHAFFWRQAMLDEQ